MNLKRYPWLAFLVALCGATPVYSADIPYTFQILDVAVPGQQWSIAAPVDINDNGETPGLCAFPVRIALLSSSEGFLFLPLLNGVNSQLRYTVTPCVWCTHGLDPRARRAYASLLSRVRAPFMAGVPVSAGEIFNVSLLQFLLQFDRKIPVSCATYEK